MSAETAINLKQIVEQASVFYLTCNPEIPDFTNHSSCRLQIFNKIRKIDLELNRSNAMFMASLLQDTIFSKSKIVICWNIKPLFTYLRHYLKDLPLIQCNLTDLFVIENYLGISQTSPKNLTEAINRVKVVTESKSWKKIYQTIHLPLITQVLPQIENNPLLDTSDRTAHYAYYEIEGQRNGRLRCFGKYNRSYVPHTMGEEIKKRLLPRGQEYQFLLADINNCEVTVLQKLTNDPKLGHFLLSGKDVYEQIYNLITGDECDSVKKRDLCKLMFLPVVYGCGIKGLSKNLNLSEPVAKDLIKRIYHYFKITMEWITAQEAEAKANGKLTDIFGRVRLFNETDYYTSRNFVVQSPAATLCLEKLIEINRIGNVLFTVHDSYCLSCRSYELKEQNEKIKAIIEKESSLYALSLKMHSKFGRKLTELQNYN